MEKGLHENYGDFISLPDNFTMLKYLRKSFGTEGDFQNIAFYPKSDLEKIEQTELVSSYASTLLEELKTYNVPDPKGNKYLIFIHPKPGFTMGVLSDTFLDLILLNYAPDEIKPYIERKRKSKYYLLNGWKPKSQNQYCEHIQIPGGKLSDTKWSKSLVKPIITYRDSNETLKKATIDYYIPAIFIEHYISEAPRIYDNGRRIEKDQLEKWGFLEKSGEEYILTTKSKILLILIQNLFLLEYWRWYFLNEYDEGTNLNRIIEEFPNCPKEIIIRAFFDVLIYKKAISIKVNLSDIGTLIDMKPDEIIKIMQNWLLGDYYGKECIKDMCFIYPPNKLDRFWADWSVINNRFNGKLEYIDRPNNKRQLDEFLNQDERVLLIKGSAGIGKTRFLVEYAKNCEENWEFYWLLLNQKVSWDILKQEIKNKKIVIILDDISLYNNWENFFEEFIKLEANKSNIKLIITASNDRSINPFISYHSKFRHEEKIIEINLLPFNFKNIETKNDLSKILLTYNLNIERIIDIINVSEGFPEIIEDYLYYYLKSKENGETTKETRLISSFDQRMTEYWENDLNKDEKELLLALSLVGSTPINAKPIINFPKDEYLFIIEQLIQKDWVKIINGTLVFNRNVKWNWILENFWIKKPEMKLKLEKTIAEFSENNLALFIKSTFVLNHYLNYVDFKKILMKIETWGNGDNFTDIYNQIIAANKLLPFIAINYMNNLKTEDINPFLAKKRTDQSLKSDIPPSIEEMFLRLAKKLDNHIGKENLTRIYNALNGIIHPLTAIQQFRCIIALIGKVIQNFKENQNKENEIFTSKYVNSLIILRFTIEEFEQPGRSEEIYLNYLNNPDLNDFNKAVIYWLWSESLFHKKDSSFSKIFLCIENASRLLLKIVDKHAFIMLWSNFLANLSHRYNKKSSFIQKEGKKKLEYIINNKNIAEEWAKELNLVRAYTSFILNWSIFDDNSDHRNNISKLQDLADYTKKNKQLHITGDIYDQIGSEYFSIANYPDSVKNFELSVDFTKKSGVLIGLADTYSKLGDAQWRILELDEAINSHNEAYKLYLNENNSPGALSSLNAIFDIEFSRGNYSKSIKISKEFSKILEKAKFSSYYGTAMMRLAEAEIFQNNYQKARSIIDRIKIENKIFDLSNKAHLMLLDLITSWKLKKILEFKSNFERFLIDHSKNINFEVNSFEMFWIIRLVESIGDSNKEMIGKLCISLKNNVNVKRSSFYIYEQILITVNKHLEFSKIKQYPWPNWALNFIKNFEKPENFTMPGSNLIDISKNPDFKGNTNTLLALIKKIEQRLLNISSEESLIILIFPFIIELYQHIALVKIEQKEIIQRIFTILKKTINCMKNSEIENHRKDLIFECLQFLSDHSYVNMFNSLTKEILIFADSITPTLSIIEKINILRKKAVIAEREGQKKEALIHYKRIYKLLEDSNDTKEKLLYKFTILNLEMSFNQNKKIEDEIIQWYYISESSSSEENFYATSVYIYFLIRKHDLIHAKNLALDLINRDDITTENIVWFISEFIDRIYIQEKLIEETLDYKIADRYIEIIYNNTELEDFKVVANYERAFLSIFNIELKKIRSDNYKIHIERCLKIIDILDKNSCESIKSVIDSFINAISNQSLESMREKQNSKYIEILKIMYEFSSKYELLQIQWLSNNMILYYLIQDNSSLDYFEWLSLYSENFVRYKNAIKPNINQLSKIVPYFKMPEDYFGLNNENLSSEDIIDFSLLYFHLISIDKIFKLLTSIEYPDWRSICNSIWLSISNFLNLPVLKKGNHKLVNGLLKFIIGDFTQIVLDFYNTSEIDNNYAILNYSIQELMKVDGIVGKIGSLMAISLNLKEENLEIRLNLFNKIKFEILGEISSDLRDIAIQTFEYLERSLNNRNIPREISEVLYIEILKDNHQNYKENNEINLLVENSINLIQSYYRMKDFTNCLNFIEKIYKLFEENGRKKEILILHLYYGWIYYEQGNLSKAENEFEFLMKHLDKLEYKDFISVLIYRLQIKIDQGENIQKEIANALNLYKMNLDRLTDKLKYDFFNAIIAYLLALKKTEIIQEIIYYLENNKVILIEESRFSAENYSKIINDYELLNKFIKNDYRGFTDLFLKYCTEDLDYIEDFIIKLKIVHWLGFLTLIEREKFNNYFYNELYRYIEQNKNHIKIKSPFSKETINEVTEEFKNTSIKSLNYVIMGILANFPEIFIFQAARE